MKKKFNWKTVALWIFFFPFIMMYYTFKFYTSKKFTVKQKSIITAIALAVFVIIGITSDATKGSELKKVTIKDINIYKNKTKKIDILISPKDADINEVSLKNFDSSIISFNNKEYKIKGLKEGTTTAICEVKDSHSNVIKSNKFTITVRLTDEQIEEKNKKAAEEAAKAEQELINKRNSISSIEGIRIRDYCKDSIDKILKSPSSAEYPDSFLKPLKDWNMTKVNNLITVSSYVDSQNSFGAMIRSNFVIQIKMQDDGSGNITYIQFDGKTIYGTYQ